MKMKAVDNILLVRVQNEDVDYLQKLRDHILDSLRSGVLVLPDWAPYEVIELPELGGVEVSQELAESETPIGAPGLIDMSLCAGTENDEAEPPPVEIAAGRNKEEKLAILERLREYRRAHGLGCWNGVAQKAGGSITPELIRDMLLGKESPPIADWRRIDRAIQK